MMRLPNRQLNRVGRGLDDGLHGARQVFDARQKRAFAKKSVVDGDVETVAGTGVKQAIQSVIFHDFRFSVFRGFLHLDNLIRELV